LLLILYIRQFFKQNELINKQHIVYFLIVISLGIHSIIDFNMSYVFISALFFVSLGGMAASLNYPVVKGIINTKKWSKIYPVTLIALSIILIFVSLKWSV